MVATILTALQW